MNEFLAIEPAELAAQRLRRRALELVDDAALKLEQFLGSDPSAIHDIRRRFKELRAMIRMVGHALPHRARAERAFLRDAGQQFAPQRDANAVVGAFDRLREHFAGEWTPRQFRKIRHALVAQPAPPIDPVALAQLRTQIATERSRIAAWPVDAMTVHDLWQALTRAYRAARRAMRDALREGTPEKFHAWRRRAKVLWYQAQFFDMLGIAKFESQIEALHKLSRVLGDHHDLVVIDELCSRSPESFGSARYVRRFRTFLARRLRSLEEQAESIGAELFEQRPREWAAAEASPQPLRRRIGPKRSATRPATEPLALSS